MQTFGAPQCPEDGLVPEGVLAALHHQREPVVDALMGLLLHKEKDHILQVRNPRHGSNCSTRSD